MENTVKKFKETIDALLVDVNSKAEEVKVNFESFKDVFGKEFEVQAENLKEYRERLEAKGKKIFNSDDLVNDVKEELEIAMKDVKTNAERLMDLLKNKSEK